MNGGVPCGRRWGQQEPGSQRQPPHTRASVSADLAASATAIQSKRQSNESMDPIAPLNRAPALDMGYFCNEEGKQRGGNVREIYQWEGRF